MSYKPKGLAIVEAARSRFVPIMMTSRATVIGLVPTALALEQPCRHDAAPPAFAAQAAAAKLRSAGVETASAPLGLSPPLQMPGAK